MDTMDTPLITHFISLQHIHSLHSSSMDSICLKQHFSLCPRRFFPISLFHPDLVELLHPYLVQRLLHPNLVECLLHPYLVQGLLHADSFESVTLPHADLVERFLHADLIEPLLHSHLVQSPLSHSANRRQYECARATDHRGISST